MTLTMLKATISFILGV